MGKPLTVQNAELVTATVELKTLSVSGKQVTLSVFRQIPDGQLFTDGFQFSGVPWGRVNYFWDGGPPQPDRQHILWQSGSDLFRTIVRKWDMQVSDVLFYEDIFQKNGATITLSPKAIHDFGWIFDDIPKEFKTSEILYRISPERARELTELTMGAVAAHNRSAANWRRAWETICALPQIYIAV